jgi:ribonuclease BN (tRNA processing enzyme)
VFAEITPSEVINPPKKPRKITILGDTNNALKIIPIAYGSDVVVHEVGRDRKN